MIRICIKSRLRIYSDEVMKCEYGHLFYYLKGFDNTCPWCYSCGGGFKERKDSRSTCTFCDEYLGELHYNVERVLWRRGVDWIDKSDQGEIERSKNSYDPNLFTTT